MDDERVPGEIPQEEARVDEIPEDEEISGRPVDEPAAEVETEAGAEAPENGGPVQEGAIEDWLDGSEEPESPVDGEEAAAETAPEEAAETGDADEPAGETEAPAEAVDAADAPGEPAAKKQSFFAKHKVAVALAAVCAVGVVGAVAATQYFIPENTLAMAEEAYQARDFDTALSYYAEIEDYKDVPDRIDMATRGNHYLEAEKSYEAGNYQAAVTSFGLASGFEDADARKAEAQQHVDYEKGDQLLEQENWLEAGLAFADAGDLDDAEAKASQCAETLNAAQRYDESSQIFAKLGSDYQDKYDQAVKYGDYAEKLTTAVSDLQADNVDDALDLLNQIPDDFTYAGNNAGSQKAYANQVKTYKDAVAKGKSGDYAGAIAAFGSLPDSFSYCGVSVGTRKSQYNTAAAVKDVCGTYTSTDASEFVVKQVSKSSGSWHSWTGDGSNDKLKLECKLNDDGSVSLTGTAEFYRYTNFSTISSLLKRRCVTVDINTVVTGVPSTISAGGATLTYSGGAWKLTWSETVTNDDIYFNYYYTANYTYTK